ncbi:ATP-binding protein [Fuscibacter oryzae]|uniref:histidine kinase n=1 Tax=Fuscibacter oryzae TaxID=2803939 RepID=A0A8J7MTT5_9RHOB|nr:ATP-binding protein [Fuscibacter oryzae]MBL4929497.1 PAS domain S-box protein [Fuscibacter oryzae]
MNDLTDQTIIMLSPYVRLVLDHYMLVIILALSLLLYLARAQQLSKQYEAALRLKDDEIAVYLRALNAHAMVNITGADGRITFASDSLARATGYAPDELVGHEFRNILLSNPKDECLGLTSKLRAGQVWTGETKIRRRDGGIMWTRSSIIPVHDDLGTLLRTISLRTDITESKLLQAERQDRAMIDRLRDEVYIFSTKTFELLYLNKRALASSNWGESETVGKRLGDLSEVFDEQAFRARVTPLLQGDVDSILYETIFRGGAVEVNLQLEHSLDGTPRFVAVVRDITERKRAENERAEFVATVSHELRSPLTSIKGSLNLIASGVAGPMSERVGSLITVAQRNVDRLLRLINDLLDLEKLDANMTDFAVAPVDIVSFAEEVVAANAGYGHEYGVELRYMGPTSPIFAMISRDGMMQVLTNLLSNAVKFSPRGQFVDLEVVERPGGIRLSIIDRGCGIPPEAHHTLFSRFVQAHTQIDRQHVGTGLGLSIAKTIIEKQAGRIWFTSKVGVGTTFHVDLPISEGFRAVA